MSLQNTAADDTRSRAWRAIPIALTADNLPSLSPKSAALGNRLYRGAPAGQSSLVWRWQPQPAFVPTAQIELAAGDDRVTLLVDDDTPVADEPITDWRELDGALRTLAWTVAHENFLDLIQVVFGCEVSVVYVSTSADDKPADDIVVRAGFKTCDENGRRVCNGVIALRRRCAVRLARRTRRFSGDRTALPLNVAFRVEIDRCDVSQKEMRDLTTGSLVRLENSTLTREMSRVVLTAGTWRLAADADDTTLTIRAVSSPPTRFDCRQLQGDIMIDESDSTPTSFAAESDESGGAGDCLTTDYPKQYAGADAAQDIDVGALPVSLQFCAGRVRLPLAQVQAMAPGLTVSLAKRIEDAPITVYANDTAVARGELVLIGDLLGVRITRTLTSAA